MKSDRFDTGGYTLEKDITHRALSGRDGSGLESLLVESSTNFVFLRLVPIGGVRRTVGSPWDDGIRRQADAAIGSTNGDFTWIHRTKILASVARQGKRTVFDLNRLRSAVDHGHLHRRDFVLHSLIRHPGT